MITGLGKNTNVISICRDNSVMQRHREIAELAYEYWLARFGVRYGSPEEDLLLAFAEVEAAKTKQPATRLFLMPRSVS